jgi:hypothetical protein
MSSYLLVKVAKTFGVVFAETSNEQASRCVHDNDNLGKGMRAEEFGDFGSAFYYFAPIRLSTFVCG